MTSEQSDTSEPMELDINQLDSVSDAMPKRDGLPSNFGRVSRLTNLHIDGQGDDDVYSPSVSMSTTSSATTTSSRGC
ncbi:MAG: hypothetical protein ABEK29_04540 [Bradymonadaceae bacterium]